MLNLLSFDVEEFGAIETLSAFDPAVRNSLDQGRVIQNTEKILAILAEANTKATFFILGSIVDKYPELVIEIHKQGHEIASHGCSHVMITKQTQQEFRDDIRRAKDKLETLVGMPIYGYRAPTFSITPKTAWALDVLKEEGFLYDSSIYPIVGHDRYGYKGAPTQPYRHANGIFEFPLSTFSLGSLRLPFGGGGYFRLLPYFVTRFLIAKTNKKGRVATFYLHPWELDAAMQKLNLGIITSFRTYNHIKKIPQRLKLLLNDFQFGPIIQHIESMKSENA